MTEVDIRKGMPARKLDRATFAPLQGELHAIVAAAWDAYAAGRKAPLTRAIPMVPPFRIAPKARELRIADAPRRRFSGVRTAAEGRLRSE
jgi:hypothetical protein